MIHQYEVAQQPAVFKLCKAPACLGFRCLLCKLSTIGSRVKWILCGHEQGDTAFSQVFFFIHYEY
jgi:hypothetical protein